MVLWSYFPFIIVGEFYNVRLQDQRIRPLFINVQTNSANHDEGFATVCYACVRIHNVFEHGPRRPRRIHNIWLVNFLFVLYFFLILIDAFV